MVKESCAHVFRYVRTQSAILILMFLLITPTFSVVMATETGSKINGKIAFHSNRDGNWEIYIMNPDGSDQRRLTNNNYDDEGPAWSPDGSKIVFSSNRDGNDEIYVMNPDGSGQTRLTNNNYNDGGPSWSPDGTKIAFSRDLGGNWEIYTMNTDGSGETRLTNNNGPWDLGPHWSPDGTKILFLSHRDGDSDIYMMNPDGSGQTILTNNHSMEELATWSPDGTKIVFSSDRDGNYEIYTMNADGSGPTRLTNNNYDDYHNCWSPDGTKIAFLSNRDDNNEIYVMNTDGTGQTRLTNNNASDIIYGAAWQNKQTATLALKASTINTEVDKPFYLNATLSAPKTDTITLYWSINNSGFIYRRNETMTNGIFNKVFEASSPGTWVFKVAWLGNEEYRNVESNTITVTVTRTLAAIVTATPPTVYSGGTSTIKTTLTSGAEPITGATINLSSSSGGAFSAVTDQGNGTYVATYTALEVVAQMISLINVSASKSGYPSTSEQTQVTVQPLTISINVKASDNTPIASVTVSSTSQPSGQAGLSGNTDAGGLVVFSGVQKGAYVFKATKSSYDDKTWNLNVQQGQATTETITMVKPSGIPGYPILSVALALLVATIILYGEKYLRAGPLISQ